MNQVNVKYFAGKKSRYEQGVTDLNIEVIEQKMNNHLWKLWVIQKKLISLLIQVVLSECFLKKEMK